MPKRFSTLARSEVILISLNSKSTMLKRLQVHGDLPILRQVLSLQAICLRIQLLTRNILFLLQTVSPPHILKKVQIQQIKFTVMIPKRYLLFPPPNNRQTVYFMTLLRKCFAAVQAIATLPQSKQELLLNS